MLPFAPVFSPLLQGGVVQPDECTFACFDLLGEGRGWFFSGFRDVFSGAVVVQWCFSSFDGGFVSDCF